MKWSKQKRESFSLSYHIDARKKGYKATVNYNDYYKTFYFLTKKDNKVYNSCWDKKEYKTEEEARTACEKWIDEQKDKKLLVGSENNDKKE